MKTNNQKREDSKKKINHKIWKDLNIEKVVKTHGFEQTKTAISKWLTYQRENAKLLKQRRELESKLADINSKL